MENDHRDSSQDEKWADLLSFQHFQSLWPARGYGYGGRIQEIRAKEFSRLGDLIYLDHVGTTLFPQSLLESFMNDLTENVYGNPHSQNISSRLTQDTIEHIRNRILQHFNTSADYYSVIFTSGSTAALKMVGETFPWIPETSEGSGSHFCYLTDNHTSVVGIRAIAASANVLSIPVTPEEVLLSERNHRAVEEHHSNIPHLFCFPAQSNFSGTKYPLSWIQEVQSGMLCVNKTPGKWFVLLDAASYVSTSPLDLSLHRADFVCLSFYKMFGFPSGLGALLVSNKIAPFLRKTYFGGGTAAAYLAEEDFYFPRESLSARFEDGTCSFLDIIALKHGFDILEKLTGGMENIKEHTFALANYTYTVLADLKHPNGTPVARIYNDTEFRSSDVQGPIINFNVLDENGHVIGYSQVDKLANLYHIHVRTGCFCNNGACQKHLGTSKEDMKKFFQAGHVCGDDVDLIDGRPTGSIRISFGYMSTFKDSQAFLKFIVDCFVKKAVQLDKNLTSQASQGKAVSESMRLPADNNQANKARIVANKLLQEAITSKNGLFKTPSVMQEANNVHLPEPETNGHDVPISVRTSNGKPATLVKIYLYPIKSCSAFEVSEWPVGMQGLLYDRNWMIVNQNGVCLSQKQEPRLCLIRPFLDLKQNNMVIKAEGMDPIKISLNDESGKQNRACQSKVCGDRVQTYDCGQMIADWLSLFLGRQCRLIQQTPDLSRNANKIKTAQSGVNPALLSLVNEAQYLLINTASILHLQQQTASSEEDEPEEALRIKGLIERFRANLVITGSKPFEEEEWTEVSIGDLNFKVMKKCTRCQIICINQKTGERSNQLLQALSTYKGGKTTFGMYLMNHPLCSSFPAVLSVGTQVSPV
ncbi:molybdenum cofactor sulfurase [Microcaecilia unicolor]|uniref:Molybdenum cofactor sulfurase n=1 Tax=Microcaecilia unicolor TaxID=1415580 RepID=A0A6P7XYV7_9AMPH|nr:molybdenum cofactor sulfurase [Microcaecilia unicolor]